MIKWSCLIILAYIFFKPLICAEVYYNLDVFLTTILLFSSFSLFFKKQIKINLLNIMVFIFLLALFASSKYSINFLKSISSLYKYLPLIILFFAIQSMDQKRKNQLIFILLLSAILVSFYGLRSLFIGTQNVIHFLAKYKIEYPFAIEYLERKRAFVPFASPNLLAGYLAMIITLCIGIIFQKIYSKKYDALFFLSLFNLIVTSVTLFLTKSLGAWISLTITLFLFFMASKTLNKNSLLVIFLLIITFAIIFSLRAGENKDFTKPLFSFYKRTCYWDETIKIIKNHPLLGVGIGNFSIEESQIAHNSYLQIWAEFGLLGLMSWLWICFIFIKKGMERVFSNNRIYCELGVFFAGLSFLIHNIVDFSFFVSQAAFLWWILLALNQEDLLLQ